MLQPPEPPASAPPDPAGWGNVQWASQMMPGFPPETMPTATGPLHPELEESLNEWYAKDMLERMRLHQEYLRKKQQYDEATGRVYNVSLQSAGAEPF
jgi:hypothetical protein